MKTRLSRWNVMLVGFASIIVFGLTGCSGGGSDTDGGPNELTVANLEGTYDLNLNSTAVMTLDDDEDFEVTMGVLTIGQNTVAFTLTATESFMETFTITGSTITVTDDEGDTEDLQAALTNNGTTLTLIDEDGDTLIFDRIGGNGNTNDLTVANLTGTYDLNLESPGVMALEDDEDDVNLEVTMGGLTIGQNTVESTLTVTGSFMETFTIAGNTITFTDDEGDTENSQATLTNNGTTLTLVDEDGDTLIFDKR